MQRFFKSILPLITTVWLLPSASHAQKPEPLKVLSTFPKGQTEGTNQTQTIVATFNKPMVALQRLPEGDGTGPLKIIPPVKGKYRWIGTSTISFTPSQPLEIATEYTVTIPADVKASDGSMLGQVVIWSFSTPRPVLLASFPGHEQKQVELRQKIFLRFSQPMNINRASSFIQMKEGSRNGSAVMFTIGFPTSAELQQARVYWPDTSNILKIVLTDPLTKGKRYVVILAKGLPGARGTLGMEKEASFAFETFGDFSFLGVDNPTNRSPYESVIFHFSNLVAIKELVKHLSFTPTISFPKELASYEWSTTEPALYLKFQPETKYKVSISKELKDGFGQTLDKDAEFTLTTRGFDPSYNMTTGHGILESYGERMYPVSVLNVNSLDVQMTKLSRETIVPVLSSDTLYNHNKPLRGFFPDVSRQWQINPKRNVRRTMGLKLDEALTANKHGVVLLEISAASKPPYLRADIQVTEMGLTAKFSPDNILVCATTLKNATPIADASVEVRNDSNRVLWQGTTDAEGCVKAPGWGALGLQPQNEWSRPRVWVTVTKDDDIAYTSSEWQEGIEPYRFNISYDWSPEYEPWQGSIFTDRGIYRAGEEVSFKGIFRNRTKSDWAVRDAEVRLKIFDSRNEQVFIDSMSLNEFGSLSSSYKIPADAHLGYYRIEAVQKKNPAKTIAAESFRVEAYRVSEFEVTAKFVGKSYIVGDQVKGSFSAKYLFGGLMKGERIKWRLRYEPSGFVPEGWEGYWFGRNAWSYDNAAGPQTKIIVTKDTTLDAKGEINVEAKTQVGDIRASGNLVLEGEVTSPSRQTISGRTNITLHGGEFYIGIQPATTFIGKDSTLRYNIITVTPDGRITSDAKLDVKILKREWHSVRKAGGDGRFSWQSAVVDTTIESATVTSSTKPLEGSFIPKKSGYYLIQVSGKDVRGNEIMSDAYFYVSGSDYVAWERTDDDHIELIADKKKYKPGEIARIIVKNPYEEASALISIEREGIMKHWRMKLKGSAPEIAIPLTEQSLPNIFVSVVLLQGRMTKKADLDQAADVGRPSFKIGYAQLNVDPGTRHLTVTTLSDKQQYRPGEIVTVNVNVKDARGKPLQTEVTMSVADKGVLNLIGYTLPDPFNMFYGPRPLSVSTTESRAQIVQARSFGEKGEDEGGGGGMDLGAVETRGNFKYTAYWNPTLRTDNTGMLTVKFKLPDNLTTFKIMAVAQSKKSEFGYAENSFTVAKPLLLQASLPRFARVGDTFEGGVVVHNNSGSEGDVALKTSSKGIAFAGKEIVEFKLKPGESKEIRQKFGATIMGKATFTFQASMGKETDGLMVSIPIQVPRRKETVAQFDAVSSSLESKLVVPTNTYEELGSIEFTASSTALTGLVHSVEYLFSYPYGCIEQKASRILPIILGKEMVEAFGLEVLKGIDAKSLVEKTVSDFKSFQTDNGGFSYWPGDGYDSPYASAFVMYVLMQARLHGYAVNKEMVDRGDEYLKGVLRNPDNMPNYPYSHNEWAGTKTLILYTLALSKKAEPAYYEAFYKNLDRIPLFAKANLLKAISASTKNKKMSEAIAENLLNSIKLNPTSAHFEEPDVRELEWCWSSNTRTTAIILQALLETNGFAGNKADLPAKIVKWLLQQQKSGRFDNTQENVYVVAALSEFYKKFESEEPKFKGEILVAGQTILSKMFEGRSLKIEKVTKEFSHFERGKELPVQMKKDGPGIMYAGLRMAYFPKEEAKVRDEGIAVLKTMELFNDDSRVGNESSNLSFAPGSIMKITLRVVTPQQRNFVVVDDPLPAGLEAINTSLQTESSETARMLANDQSQENQYRWWGSFNHQELRDDRVLLFADELAAGVHTYSYLARATTFGKFEMPATYTEMMYEPEVFGQTGSVQVEVK